MIGITPGEKLRNGLSRSTGIATAARRPTSASASDMTAVTRKSASNAMANTSKPIIRNNTAFRISSISFQEPVDIAAGFFTHPVFGTDVPDQQPGADGHNRCRDMQIDRQLVPAECQSQRQQYLERVIVNLAHDPERSTSPGRSPEPRRQRPLARRVWRRPPARCRGGHRRERPCRQEPERRHNRHRR